MVAVTGEQGMRMAGDALASVTPVLAAGVGVQRGWYRALRAASFRIEAPLTGRTAVGISVSSHRDGSAMVDLLAGRARPSHGELRVLGEDMSTARGRAAVRAQVGLARGSLRPRPVVRMRGLAGRGLAGRAVRLAAAAAGRPGLLLIDGLLDDLGPVDAAALAAAIRGLGRDIAIVATGRDIAALRLICDDVLTLANGIIVKG